MSLQKDFASYVSYFSYPCDILRSSSLKEERFILAHDFRVISAHHCQEDIVMGLAPACSMASDKKQKECEWEPGASMTSKTCFLSDLLLSCHPHPA